MHFRFRQGALSHVGSILKRLKPGDSCRESNHPWVIVRIGSLESNCHAARQRTEESQRFQANFEEEARQKEEQKQLAASLQDRCNSLMKQFESLSSSRAKK